MGDLSGSDSRYRVNEVKNTEKGRVVIAGLVNNDFEHSKKINAPLIRRDGVHRSSEQMWVIH